MRLVLHDEDSHRLEVIMSYRTTMGRLVLAAAFAVLVVPNAVAAQKDSVSARMTEAEAVRALSTGDLTSERNLAVMLATELGPQAGPALRSAILREAWAELRGERGRPLDEHISAYIYAVAQLRDPASVPFLVETMRYSSSAADALADIGAVVLPPVLAAVDDPQTDQAGVRSGFTVLRWLIEEGNLDAGQTEEIGEAALRRLTSGPQETLAIFGALHVAVVLREPDLMKAAQALAHEPGALEALAASQSQVGWIRREARDLLSGARKPFPERRSRREG